MFYQMDNILIGDLNQVCFVTMENSQVNVCFYGRDSVLISCFSSSQEASRAFRDIGKAMLSLAESRN